MTETAPGTALVPTSNVEAYRASTEAASICREIVVKTAKDIQGRKFVPVEGWQSIALAHGCAASALNVERIEGGVRAVGEVRRLSDGALISQAEGFVGEDEATWFGGEISTRYGTKVLPRRLDYAIRAMAQTRAISRACRSAFAHVVVMMDAGLSTTPAEEMSAAVDAEFTEVAPAEGRKADAAAPAQQTQQRKPGPTSAELKKEGAWERYTGEMKAQRNLGELKVWADKVAPVINTWPKKWIDAFREEYAKTQKELKDAAGAKAAPPADEDEGPPR